MNVTKPGTYTSHIYSNPKIKWKTNYVFCSEDRLNKALLLNFPLNVKNNRMNLVKKNFWPQNKIN